MNKKMFCSLIFFLFILTIFTAQSLTTNIFQPIESKKYLGLHTQENWIKQQKLLSSHGAVLDNYNVALSNKGTPAFIEKTGDDTGWISRSGNVFAGLFENLPPYIPNNPIPKNGSVNQPRVLFLFWLGGDPDPEDYVTYDVYFGTSSPPPKVVSNQSFNNYIPGVLEYSTTYYWKIVSWDNNGSWAVGPIWHFTTILDTTPPFTTHIFNGLMGNNDWYISRVIITLNALDNQSGVNHTYYKFDDDFEWIEYTQPFYAKVDGLYVLYYYSVDMLGNEEEVNNATLRIDKTAPNITLTVMPENDMKNKWLLNATVADLISGVAKVDFCVDDVLIGNVSTPGPYVWHYEGHGKKARAIVYDKAGNPAMSAQVDDCGPNIDNQPMLLPHVMQNDQLFFQQQIMQQQ
jgi:hypothetical protein